MRALLFLLFVSIAVSDSIVGFQAPHTFFNIDLSGNVLWNGTTTALFSSKPTYRESSQEYLFMEWDDSQTAWVISGVVAQSMKVTNYSIAKLPDSFWYEIEYDAQSDSIIAILESADWMSLEVFSIGVSTGSASIVATLNSSTALDYGGFYGYNQANRQFWTIMTTGTNFENIMTEMLVLNIASGQWTSTPNVPDFFAPIKLRDNGNFIGAEFGWENITVVDWTPSTNTITYITRPKDWENFDIPLVDSTYSNLYFFSPSLTVWNFGDGSLTYLQSNWFFPTFVHYLTQ
eukprot:TRINITY_DN4428_c0_g1_i1.p1 TRINITY_DN4428_c0_g1~~TRINITY_DN4428_c0_g1_i1.p1  ORF type:complete len:303 (-),score=90.12 TRINITY_DN4428_c0_g1_i1:55-921(-)